MKYGIRKTDKRYRIYMKGQKKKRDREIIQMSKKNIGNNNTKIYSKILN